MLELKPLTQIRIASDHKTEMADLHEWAPMEVDPHFGEPMWIMKDLITATVRETLLNMRRPR